MSVRRQNKMTCTQRPRLLTMYHQYYHGQLQEKARVFYVIECYHT